MKAVEFLSSLDLVCESMDYVKVTYRVPVTLYEEMAAARKITGLKLRSFFEAAIDRLPSDEAQLIRVIWKRPSTGVRLRGARMRELPVSMGRGYSERIADLAKRSRVAPADLVRAALANYVRDLPGRSTALGDYLSSPVWVGGIPEWIKSAKPEHRPLKSVVAVTGRLVDHGILYLSVVRPRKSFRAAPISEKCAHFLHDEKPADPHPTVIFVHRRHFDEFVKVFFEGLLNRRWSSESEEMEQYEEMAGMAGLTLVGKRQRAAGLVVCQKMRNLTDSRFRVIDVTPDDILAAEQFPASIPFFSRLILAGAKRDGGDAIEIASATVFADHAREAGFRVMQPDDLREVEE
ncbi:MAG: hypothetical protein JWL90_2917 [Chthoniobacteraceae bacterium]|nr:hypothetical protein [Chthoniobacteraceae bacterium]